MRRMLLIALASCTTAEPKAEQVRAATPTQPQQVKWCKDDPGRTDPWCFKSECVVISCEGPSWTVIHANGHRYGNAPGTRPIYEIMLPHPKIKDFFMGDCGAGLLVSSGRIECAAIH